MYKMKGLFNLRLDVAHSKFSLDSSVKNSRSSDKEGGQQIIQSNTVPVDEETQNV